MDRSLNYSKLKFLKFFSPIPKDLMENVLLVFIPSIESKELKHHCFRLPQGCELTVFSMYAYLIYCVSTFKDTPSFLKINMVGAGGYSAEKYWEGK